MARKSKSRGRSKKKKTSPILIFIFVIIALAAISMLLGYYLLQDDSDKGLKIFGNESNKLETITPEQPGTVLKEKPVEEKPTLLEGTWVSNYDGNIMTIHGLGYTLESPSVDHVTKITGRLSIEKNIITFVSQDGDELCENTEGHYLFTLQGSDEIFFKLIKDTCTKRKERMTLSWFKL